MREEVSVIAAELIERMKRSGRRLSTQVDFTCDLCQDTGVVQKRSGWAPCECEKKKEGEEQPKAKKTF